MLLGSINFLEYLSKGFKVCVSLWWTNNLKMCEFSFLDVKKILIIQTAGDFSLH